MKYQVIVGNIGTVTDTDNKAEATGDYWDYVDLSISDYGRGGNEDVTLMEDGEPIKEHFGNKGDQD